MYYNLEDDFQIQKQDIDKELSLLEERKISVEAEYESSSKTKEDYEKYNYKLLAIAENKNKLLETKLLKETVATSKYRADYFDLLERTRFMLAEKLFLCLLCGFATTVFYPAPDSIMDFIMLLAVTGGSLFFILLLCTFLFPKKQTHFWFPMYKEHPFISAVILFVIVAAVISVIKLF